MSTTLNEVREALEPLRQGFKNLIDAYAYKHDVGALIRDLRTELRLKQSELAERAGVTKAYISRLETGSAKGCSVDAMAGIAAALDVSLDYLMGMGTDLGSAQDLAFYRFYLEQPDTVRQRIRAVASVLMAEGEPA